MATAKRKQNQHRRTRQDHATELAEDYVEAIAAIVDSQGQCRAVDLARQFEVSHVTVNRTIGRGEGSAADFVLITRGGHKNLVLELNDVTTVAAIEVRLKPVVERTSTPAAYRRAARLPGANVMFRLSDLQNGKSVHPIRVGRFTDSITVKRIRPGAPLEHEFEFIDRDSPQPGDYYFVRVRQIDGGTAWSSPIWVGGLSMRYEK